MLRKIEPQANRGRRGQMPRVEEALLRAEHAFMSWRNTDGGWPSEPGELSNAWATAQGVALLQDHDPRLHHDGLDQAVGWLYRDQNDDGGWGIDRGISDVTGTEQVLYALSLFGPRSGEERQRLREGARWLAGHQSEADGGWAFLPKNTISSVYCTAWGIASLAAYGRASGDQFAVRANLPQAKQFLRLAQNDSPWDPGWGKFTRSETEGMRTAYALLGLHAGQAQHGAPYARGVKALKVEQRHDGGWGDDGGSNCEGTAHGVLALLAAGRNPFGHSVRMAVKHLLASQNAIDHGWPERPGAPSTVWCTQHALLALRRYRQVAGRWDAARTRQDVTAGLRHVFGALAWHSRRHGWALTGVLAVLASLFWLSAALHWRLVSGVGAHSAVIAVIAGICTIGNVARVTTQDLLARRRRGR